MLFYFQSLEYENIKSFLDNVFRSYYSGRNGTAFVCVVIILIVMDLDKITYLHSITMLIHCYSMCCLYPDKLEFMIQQSKEYIKTIETYENSKGLQRFECLGDFINVVKRAD